MKKTFVLDTNVLIHDPTCLKRFQENDIVIPVTVVEELDGLKKGMDEVGRNAREVTRQLDKMRSQAPLDEGVELPNGGTLIVKLCCEEVLFSLPRDLRADIPDNRIIAVAKELKDKGSHTILVSKDSNVLIKANSIGIMAQDYQNDKVDISELYTGTAELMVGPESVNDLHGEDESFTPPEKHGMHPNQCITVINNINMQTSLGRYNADEDRVFKIGREADPMDLTHRNREQEFALDLLMDPTVNLVTLVGKAGTGKTLLAIAAGLYGAMETEFYTKVAVYRPVTPLGKQNLGFLPGDESEKLNPWMQPIFDNIEVLMGGRASDVEFVGHRSKVEARLSPAEELIQAGVLEIGGLYAIRGRSLPKLYLIVDEAQNLTPHEAKTIITRAGEGTKVVLTGDPDQIDNPYLDSCSNGLTYVAERFKNEQMAGHLTLVKGERSALAERAAELL